MNKYIIIYRSLDDLGATAGHEVLSHLYLHLFAENLIRDGFYLNRHTWIAPGAILAVKQK